MKMGKVSDRRIGMYPFEKSSMSAVIDFCNHYYRLRRGLGKGGFFSEELSRKCETRLEKMVYDLATVALKIDKPISNTSSSFTSVESSATSDESMTSTTSRAQSLAPPGVDVSGTSVSSSQGDLHAPSPTPRSSSSQPIVTPVSSYQNMTFPPGISRQKKVLTFKRGSSLGRTGSFGNLNRLSGRGRNISRRKLRSSSRTAQSATLPQYNQRHLDLESQEGNDDYDDELVNGDQMNNVIEDFNATFCENPDNLSGIDCDHNSLYETIQKTLDPLQWRLKPCTEAVRKLFQMADVKEKIRDFMMEHVQFRFHISSSREGMDKFLCDVADCFLPPGDERRTAVVDYLRNCAQKPSTNFGKIIKLMIYIHVKYCSEACARRGSLYENFAKLVGIMGKQ